MDREQALDTALGQIERAFGKGAVMKMNDAAAVSVGAVSSGSLSLDLALGIGGLPRGRIVEIFGPESSGKTTGEVAVWNRLVSRVSRDSCRRDARDLGGGHHAGTDLGVGVGPLQSGRRADSYFFLSLFSLPLSPLPVSPLPLLPLPP